MFLYSFLGLLTLQIGVAVLSGLFINLAVCVTISNFLVMKVEKGTVPINYIILGIFVLLLLVTGIVMFLAAYNENKGTCMFAVILVVVVLLIFLATSLISFLNISSMNNKVCVYRHHCSESLWLSSLRYKTKYNDVDYEDYHNSSEEPEPNTNDTKALNSPDLPDLPSVFDTRRREGGAKATKKEPKATTELTVNFPLDLSGLNDGMFKDYNDNEGVLRIFKRSITSILNYMIKEPLYRRGTLVAQKYTKDGGNKTGNGTTKSTTEVNDYTTEEENEVHHTKSQYIVGVDMFLAIILFILITSFFIFTIIVLLSYRKQLIYISLYAVNPASKHYIVEC